MKKRTKVYMGIPSTGDRVDAQMYTLRKLEEIYKEDIELVYPPHFIGRIFHDYARNEVVEEFLKSDCDILWFLDSDVVPPTNVLDLITTADTPWALAGAPYPVFMGQTESTGPKVVYTVYNHDGKAFHPAPIPKDGRAMVDGIATGCLFIKREVLLKLVKPYFEFKYEAESRRMIEGEDLGFCRKVRDLGYKFYTDFSMVCKHFKKVDLLDVNNYAIEYANAAVMECDINYRQAFARLALKLDELKAKKAPKSSLILP